MSHRAPVSRQIDVGELADGHLRRVAQIHRVPLVGEHEPVKAVHHVADVAEAPRLRPIAEDRDGLALQRLIHKRGHHAPVVKLHPRSVGIEDSRDVGADPVHPVVGHRERLGEAFAFVVAGARPDRVHVAPIGLGLRVLSRIAVALRSRRQQKPRVLAPRQFQQVPSAGRSGVEGLDRMRQVVLGTGRRGQVQHPVDGSVDFDGLAHILLHEPESRMTSQVGDVLERPCQQIVKGDDGVILRNQAVAEMRTDKAGRAGQDQTQAVPLLFGGLRVGRQNWRCVAARRTGAGVSWLASHQG